MPVDTIAKLVVANSAVYLSMPTDRVPVLARVVASAGTLIKVVWLTARKGEIDGWYSRNDFELYA